ncbi:hypothetical protein Tco_1481904 [Tanacetum coccineum]
MQGLTIEVDLYVLPMKGPDVVLGIQCLKGEESLHMKRISLYHMQALLEADDVYGVYEVHSFSMVPTTLPPHRIIDHIIHLLPNTKPVNVHPYRYLHCQKGEMEKLVKEMMEQDYQALNEVTVKDKFPIPTTNEMFDELGGAEHQFYVKRSKCVFGAATLEYLGHIIMGHGIEMDPKKVAAVREWFLPKSL